MATRKINVEGMSCGHCIQWLSEALMKIDGVRSAKVSLERKNVVVDYDGDEVSDDMMASAIEKAGYTAVSFE